MNGASSAEPLDGRKSPDPEKVVPGATAEDGARRTGKTRRRRRGKASGTTAAPSGDAPPAAAAPVVKTVPTAVTVAPPPKKTRRTLYSTRTRVSPSGRSVADREKA